MSKFEIEQLNKRIFGKPKRSLLNDISNVLLIFVAAVFVVFIFFSRTYTGMMIKGSSMMPTYNKNYLEAPTKYDIAYYTPVQYNEYKRGDIVIASTTKNSDPIIKRVIGLPGDKIEIRLNVDGLYYVYVNNVRLIEDYIYSQADMYVEYEKFSNLFGAQLIVPKDSLFILGDNRGHSNDSTYYGCFNYRDILGRVDYSVKSSEIPIISLFIQLFLPIFY